MDTTIFLLDLLHEKKEPGCLPMTGFSDLDKIKNNLTIFNPELVIHLACAFNEPQIVNYVLDRYDMDPNKNIRESPHSGFDSAIMFGCIEVLCILFERKIFPKSWYNFFLFSEVYKYDDLVNLVINNYSEHIKLSVDEIQKITAVTHNDNLKKLLLKN